MRRNHSIHGLASVLATGPLSFRDIRDLTRPISFLLQAKNRAGTNPTLDVKLQQAGVEAIGSSFVTVGTEDNKLKSGASTNVGLAAVFTQSGARSISKVALKLNKIGTITAGKKVTVEIRTTGAGLPLATVLGTTTIDIDSAIGTSYGWVEAVFTTDIDLADATAYAVVLTADYTASATNCVQWRDAVVASAGNFTVSSDGTGTWAAITATKSFEYILSQRTYADITGGAFTQLATALNGSRQILTFSAEDLTGATVRGYATVGGTASPDFFVSLEANAESR